MTQKTWRCLTMTVDEGKYAMAVAMAKSGHVLGEWEELRDNVYRTWCVRCRAITYMDGIGKNTDSPGWWMPVDACDALVAYNKQRDQDRETQRALEMKGKRRR